MSVGEALVDKVRDGRVLIISMHREGKRNAVDRALADALDAAFNELEDGNGYRCLWWTSRY
jgi:enoyl-CoA hydratase/carnithine racemase